MVAKFDKIFHFFLKTLYCQLQIFFARYPPDIFQDGRHFPRWPPKIRVTFYVAQDMYTPGRTYVIALMLKVLSLFCYNYTFRGSGQFGEDIVCILV